MLPSGVMLMQVDVFLRVYLAFLIQIWQRPKSAIVYCCGNVYILRPISSFFMFGLVTDEQGVEANDSDSSPPRSRGRGRFEKGRIKGVPRGQSDDTRSTSSQGMDDTESSSHVRETRPKILLCHIQLKTLPPWVIVSPGLSKTLIRQVDELQFHLQLSNSIVRR